MAADTQALQALFDSLRERALVISGKSFHFLWDLILESHTQFMNFATDLDYLSDVAVVNLLKSFGYQIDLRSLTFDGVLVGTGLHYLSMHDFKSPISDILFHTDSRRVKNLFDLHPDFIEWTVAMLLSWLLAAALFSVGLLLKHLNHLFWCWWLHNPGPCRFCGKRRLKSTAKRYRSTNLVKCLLFCSFLTCANTIDNMQGRWSQDSYLNAFPVDPISGLRTVFDVGKQPEVKEFVDHCDSLFWHETCGNFTIPGIFMPMTKISYVTHGETPHCMPGSGFCNMAEQTLHAPVQAHQLGISETVEIGEEENKADYDFSFLMQLNPRPTPECCSQHLDPSLYWDRLSTRSETSATGVIVWLTDSLRIGQMQYNIYQLPWNPDGCIRCSFLAQPLTLDEQLLVGPLLVRPQPRSLDGPPRLHYIALTQRLTDMQRAFHLTVHTDIGLRRGTLILGTMYGITNVPAVFDSAYPSHRCRTFAWCRARWHTSTQSHVVWWPSAFYLNDITHLEIDEVITASSTATRYLPVVMLQPSSQSASTRPCPDVGTTTYEDDEQALLSIAAISHPKYDDIQFEYQTFDDDLFSVMHVSSAASRSRSRSPDEHQQTGSSPQNEAGLRSRLSSVGSDDTETEAILVFGRSIEPELIPVTPGTHIDRQKQWIARHFEISRDSSAWEAMSLYPLIPVPADLAPSISPILVAFEGERDPDHSLVLVDITLYPKRYEDCTMADDEKVPLRETWFLPISMTRSVFLYTIGLTELCNNLVLPCIVLYGEHAWHLQDGRPYPIVNGLYLQVNVPIPNPDFPLVFYLQYSRERIPLQDMLTQWQQRLASTARQMTFFDSDDDGLLHAAAEAETTVAHDDHSLLATNRPIAMAPPLALGLIIKLYSCNYLDQEIHVDPALGLGHYREIIGDALGINHESRAWDNFLIFRVVPTPVDIDPFTHEPYIVVLPGELVIDNSFVLVDIHFRMPVQEVCREQPEPIRKVFRLLTRSSRITFLRGLGIYELCIVSGHDSCEVELGEITWPAWEMQVRHALDGHYAKVILPIEFPEISIQHQLEAARQGWSAYTMIRRWTSPPDLSLIQIRFQMMRKPLLATYSFALDPTTGLRPPGNTVDLDTLDEVVFNGTDYVQLDRAKELQTISLVELLRIPTPQPRTRGALKSPTLDTRHCAASTTSKRPNVTCQVDFSEPFADLEVALKMPFDEWGLPSSLQDCVGLSSELCTWLPSIVERRDSVASIWDIDEIAIYTDGSYNGKTSSWAFAVLVWHSQRWSLLGFSSGPSFHQPDAETHHSALVGELSALLAASWWSIRLAHAAQWYGQISFFWDSTVAGGKADGRFLSTNTWLGRQVRATQQALEQCLGYTMVKHSHVKAHSGILPNEFVDHLAKQALDQATTLHSEFLLLQKVLMSQTLDWLWLLVHPDMWNSSLPELHANCLKWNSNSDCSSANVEDIAQHMGFCPQSQSTPGMRHGRFELQCGSYNCLTLGLDTLAEGSSIKQLGIVGLMRNKCETLGFHVLGVQEARTMSGTQKSSTHFRLASGAESNGTLGTELWISLTLPYFSSSDAKTRHFFKPRDFSIIHADPRMLMVHHTNQALPCLFVVAHAPHQGHQQVAVNEWWEQLITRLEQWKGLDCIMMIDANERIYGDEGPYFGSLQDGTDTRDSMHLRELAARMNVFAPSTFAQWHVGETSTWWHPNGKSKSRINYIFLPLSWKPAWISSWTENAIQSGHAGLDHVCVAISAQWDWSAPCNVKGKVVIDARAIMMPANADKVADILSRAPGCPWTMNASQHAAHLQTYLVSEFREHFPKKKGMKSWSRASDETLLLFHCMVKAKREVRLYLQFEGKIWMRFFFDLWRNRPWTAESLSWTATFFRHSAQAASRLPQLNRTLRQNLRKERAAFLNEVAQQASQAPATELFRLLRPILSKKTKKGPGPLPQLRKLDGSLTTTATEVADRWVEHFSLLEAGEERYVADFIGSALDRQQQECLPSEWTWQHFPNLSDFEDSIRKVHLGKVAGPDGIPAEVFKCWPAISARLLLPLAWKFICRLEEPVQFKGGTLVSLYKGRGSFDSCQSFRAIMLMSNAGKMLRAAMRSRASEAFLTGSDPLQLGGKPSQNVIFGAQCVRHYQLWHKQQNKSCAVIFCDISSAYYRALRELSVGATCSDQDIATVVKRLGLSEEVMPRLYSALEGATSTKELHQDPVHSTWLKQGLSSTWFSMDGQRLIETFRGSRPGDSWADLIFSMLFHEVLMAIKADLQDMQLLIDLPELETRTIFPPWTWSSTQHTLFHTTWADDLAVMLSIRQPAEAPKAITQAAGSLLTALGRHGMQASLGTGKTEVLVLLRGKFAVVMRRRLFATDSPTLPVITEEAVVQLPLTASYKHLGGLLTSSCTLMAELHARVSKARAALGRISKHILQVKEVPLMTKIRLFKSLVLSVLYWGAGAWPRLSQKEYVFLATATWELYRRLLPRGRTEKKISCDKLLCELHLPHPQDFLHEVRCRHLASLVRSAPGALWSLLPRDDAAISAYQSAIQWMWSAIERDGTLPPPNDWTSWSTIMQSTPSVWKRLVRTAAARHLAFRCRVAYMQQWQRQLLGELQAFTPFSPVCLDETDRHVCLLCDKGFDQKRGWFLHAFVRHGYKTVEGRAVQGIHCPCCAKNYRSTDSLRNHLRYSAHCRAFFWQKREEVIPVSQDAAPVHPQCPWLPATSSMMVVASEEVDVDFQEVVSRLELAFTQLGLREDVTAVQVCHSLKEACTVALPFETICAGLMHWVETHFDDFLPVHLEGISSVHTWMVHPRRARSDGTEVAQVDVSIPLIPKQQITRSWRSRELLVFHFYSGRRRPGDLQCCLEKLDIPSGHVLTVLSIDVMVCPQKGDLAKPEQQQRWLSVIRAGEVAGTINGPPCETWSVARYYQLLGHKNSPKPVRSLSHLWGLLGLRKQEDRQVTMGNVLLAFSLISSLIQALSGGFAVLEHPADPHLFENCPVDAPTIWRCLPIDWLRQTGIFQFVMTQQGHFGAPSPKPTCLMVAGLQSERVVEIELHNRRTRLPSKGTIGLEKGGWATSKLKEYPEPFCDMISALFADWLVQSADLPWRGPTVDLEWLRVFHVSLFHHVEHDGPGPDFFQGNATN